MQTVKILALVFGFALVAAACGDSTASLNPTAPSALSSHTVDAEASAEHVASGSMANNSKPAKGNGKDKEKEKEKDKDKDKAKLTPVEISPGTTVVPLLPSLSKMEIEGLIAEVGTNFIVVNSQKVTVAEKTVIRHGNVRFKLSDLRPGDRVHVRAMRVSSSADATTNASRIVTLTATDVKLQANIAGR